MRPKSIAMFEALYVLAILIEIARVLQQWWSLLPVERGSLIAQAAVSLLLVLLAARWRIRWGGIILAALFVIGLPYAGEAIVTGNMSTGTIVTTVQVGLQLVALVLFFTSASRAWTAGKADGAADTPRTG